MSDTDANDTIEYRTIPDYPGYRVGNDGSVWSSWARNGSHCNKPWRLLKQWINSHGYAGVRLKNKSGYWSVSVHRLVLERFVGPCPIGMNGAHNNGIRNDNRLENLRWDTQKNNCADKKLHGTSQQGSRHGMAILAEADISPIFSMLNQGMTCGEVAKKFAVAKPTIEAVRSGRLWSHIERPNLRLPSNEVQRSLIDKLVSHGYSAEDVGPLTGVSQSMISMVRNRKRTMRLKYELTLQSAVDKLFRPGKPDS